jgi:Putative binding domain, N-terminal
MLKRLWMIGLLVLLGAAACGPRPVQTPAPPATVPAPSAKAKPKPAQPRILGIAPHAAEAQVGLAPVPAAPTVQQTSETVAPTEIVGVAFCAAVNSGWNANRWYITYIDTVQQPWPGPLIPQAGDVSGLCYQTDKKFQFAEGTHTLGVGLVNHCEQGDLDSACQSCAAQNGGVTCGDAASATTPITVVSTTSPVTCTFTLAPTTATVVPGGGTGTITVTASDLTCTWVATTDVVWLTVTPSSGTGSGALTYTVPATTAGPRSGNVLLGGQKVFISQQGAPCILAIDPASATAPASGTTSSVAVTVKQGGGCPWSATASAAWLTVTSATGQDNGTVAYTVAANATPDPRTATLTIAGNGTAPAVFQLTQSGTMTDKCAPGQPDAPTITYLRTNPTNPKSSQPMNPQYQITSTPPVSSIVVRMNGAIVGQLGPGTTPLTSVGGQWFNAPAKGSYVLTIDVVNGSGCTRTSGNVGITVR